MTCKGRHAFCGLIVLSVLSGMSSHLTLTIIAKIYFDSGEMNHAKVVHALLDLLDNIRVGCALRQSVPLFAVAIFRFKVGLSDYRLTLCLKISDLRWIFLDRIFLDQNSYSLLYVQIITHQY